MAMPRQKGMSLVEILAVVAIVAVLLALLVPALSASRRKAYATDDLSRLRQLGQAAALYHDQADRWPRGVPDLVDAGLAPKEIAVSTLDRSPLGIANEMAADWGRDHRPGSPNDVPYRLSFMGQRELRIPEDFVDQCVVTSGSGGWLVDPTESHRGHQPDYTDATGHYRRLQYDGAVVWKPFVSVETSDSPKMGPARTPMTLFVDPDEEIKKWFKLHS